MTIRKFYRTTVQVDVLSENPLCEDTVQDLEWLRYAITEGDCSGKVSVAFVETLDGQQAAKALTAQASDPGFFNLTDDGEDAE